MRVGGDDYARLGEDAEALTVFVGNRCYMRMFEGHCASLVADTATGELTCSTYATRPEVCRALARGSAECAGEIYEKHERPLILLRSSK